jgi:uncharacterized OB-fold protein
VIEQAPLPAVDEDTAGFWEGAAKGELRIPACAACGRLRFPPRPMCPYCRSTEVRWQTMSGRGTVWSFVVAHPPLLPAFQAVAPYNVVVVALDEDETIRLVGNLVPSADGGINAVPPADIRIGLPVEVVFQAAGDGISLPRWVPQASTEG